MTIHTQEDSMIAILALASGVNHGSQHLGQNHHPNGNRWLSIDDAALAVIVQ